MRIAKLLVLIGCLGLCGCSDTIGFFQPDPTPPYEQLLGNYNQTILQESTTTDVLTVIHLPEYELFSQSKRVAGSLGQGKKGYKTWLHMVAFDENNLRAKHKYLVVVEERPKILFVEPWENMRFDSKVVLESKILDEPYANENARRIAILKVLRENCRKDIDELGSDNKMISISGMMINQMFESVLVKLKSSPAYATKLSDSKGLEFSHFGLDKGKIQMVIDGDIVTVKAILGSLAKKWKFSEDVN